MEQEETFDNAKYFKDPFSLVDLVNQGAALELNLNIDDALADALADEFCNELNFDDNELIADDVKNSIPSNTTLKMMLTKPFDELRPQMEKINQFIYKKITKLGDIAFGTVPINARVCLRYHAYFELETKPFDATSMSGAPFIFQTGQNNVLVGIENAVMSMRPGEEAQFIISYKLLFGELGCPPRIQPRADCLYVIKLKSFNLLNEAQNTKTEIPEDERNNFISIIERVKILHTNGLYLTKQQNFKSACVAFEKAIDLLNYCHMMDADDECQQVKYLLKLYTNIAVLYNKRNLPQLVCIACREIRRLTDNKPSCKALFQEAVALTALGDYDRASNLLHKAQTIMPNNKTIKNELKMLEQRQAQIKENGKTTAIKAFELMKNVEESEKDKEKNSIAFEQEFTKFLNDIKKTVDQIFELPFEPNQEEIDLIEKIVKSYNFKLISNTTDDGLKRYFVER